MKTLLLRTASLAGITGLSLVFFGIAHADYQFGGNDNNSGGNNDWVVTQDRASFDHGDFSHKFGLQFHTHRDVCTDLSDDTANCNARVVTDAGGRPNVQTTPTGYNPAQILKAYGLTGTAAGKVGPVIAIVDAYNDPNALNDLNAYSTTFHIPTLPSCSGAIANATAPCFQKVSQSGSTTSLPQTDSGWALEISLDVQAAHAVCQNCRILLVEANSATYANLMAAEDKAVALGGKVVSNSYGGSEFSSETSYDTHFNHPGIAFVASSGDGGYGVEYPAASKYVTAVGGTTLLLNASGTYNSETAWSGSGSGCSLYESKPGFQHDASCAKRTVADVSADADPNTGAAVYDSTRYSGVSGWFQVGGTSLASPLIAATYALGATIPATTQANSLPYANSLSLNDVKSGSNGTCAGSYLCTALTGYDGPTGLGSPKGVGAF